MANKDAAFGFKPTRHLSGGLIRAEEYAIANNASASIFTGQVVEAVAGGGIEAAAAGDTQQLGVFGGCFLNWQEWKELPELDLDVIFVSIEKISLFFCIFV